MFTLCCTNMQINIVFAVEIKCRAWTIIKNVLILVDSLANTHLPPKIKN